MKNYLFIGNSFTFYYDVYRQFAETAWFALQEKIHADYVGRGGHKLTQFADPADEYGAQMLALLKGDTKYDRIVIQEQSSRPMVDFEKFREGFIGVYEAIKKYQPEAQVSLYSTWGYHEDHPQMAEFGKTTAEMEEALYRAYKSVGDEFGVPVTRVGMAFLRLYKETKLSPYGGDLKHPCFTGSYLSALTHFYTEFPDAPETCETPRHLPSVLSGKVVRRIAYEVAHGIYKKEEA